MLSKFRMAAIALLAAVSVVLATESPAFAATAPPGEWTNYQPETINGGTVNLTLTGTIAEARSYRTGTLMRVWRANDDTGNIWLSINGSPALTANGARSYNSPQIVPFGDDAWMVVHTGVDNHIYWGVYAFNNDGSLGFDGWHQISGQTTSLTPSVTAMGINHQYQVYMAYHAADGLNMWGTFYNGAGWQPPQNMGGQTYHSPAVTWNQAANRLYAVHTGTDNQVYYAYQPYGGHWTGWGGVGGVINGPPAIAASSTGNMQVAGRAFDNRLWFTQIDVTATTQSGWTQDYDTISVGWAPYLVAIGAAIYVLATAANDHRAWYKQSFSGSRNW